MASPSANQMNMQRPPPSSPSRRGGMERIPPQDLDAEMALLGSMMMSRDAIAEVVPVISRSTSHWLYRPDHQKLFEVLLDLFDDPTKAIDLVVVADELRRRVVANTSTPPAPIPVRPWIPVQPLIPVAL